MQFPKPAKGRTVTDRSAASGGDATPLNDAKNPTSNLLEELDTAFDGYILGVQSAMDCEIDDFETIALRKLSQLLKADIAYFSLVPRLPLIIPKVMNNLRNTSRLTQS
ncbi:MAG: hypothetical protein WAL92_18415 [Thiogranum sp.]